MTQFARKKLPNGAIIENQAERYSSARRYMTEECVSIMHIRPTFESVLGTVGTHNGGMTVAYRQADGDSFVEIATAMCSPKDIYNRKVGTVLSVEQFANERRIRVPLNGLHPTEVVLSLFQHHFAFDA